MGSNVKMVMSRADKGYADKIADGERYLGHFRYAKRLGYQVLKPTKSRVGCVVFDGGKCVFFKESEPFLSNIWHPRHNDKYETKELLKSIGVGVPVGQVFEPGSDQLIVDWYIKSGLGQVVLKPASLNKGKGVFVGISSVEDLKKKYSRISSYSCVLEEQLKGDEHRFLVVGGRVVAVARRTAANIIGDGESKIKELIERKNKKRMESIVHRKNIVKIDDELLSYINGKGYDLDSVPDLSERVFLREVSNVSMGGDSEDVTGNVHESFIEIAERIWDVFNDRAVYGVDLICSDITKPAEEVGYGVIEINNRPMLAGLHGHPIYGSGRQVGKKIIDYVFG